MARVRVSDAALSSSSEPAPGSVDDPTENPAHYLRLLDELHDHGVLNDDEYTGSRTRFLERLRD